MDILQLKRYWKLILVSQFEKKSRIQMGHLWHTMHINPLSFSEGLADNNVTNCTIIEKSKAWPSRRTTSEICSAEFTLLANWQEQWPASHFNELIWNMIEWMLNPYKWFGKKSTASYLLVCTLQQISILNIAKLN